MKLEETKTTFYEASSTLSENARKLCFAGIATVWIFKVGDKNAGGIAFSADLLWPLGAFVTALVLDALQYFYKSTAWWLYFAIKHRAGIKDDDEVSPPAAINFFTFVFFYLKIVACGYGCFRLLSHILNALEHSTTGP